MAPHRLSRRNLLLASFLAAGTSGVTAKSHDRFSSGFRQIDDGVLPTLEFLSRVFRLEGDWLPDFSFFDDGERADARAEDPIPGFTRMHVKIGRRAVAETIKISSGDFGAALTGVFAHEFGHVYQYKKGYRKRLLDMDANASVRLVEIHSDFLAGWTLPQAWWIRKVSDLRVAAEQFFELGDIQFEAQGHHGTSLQRQTLMAAGYTWGLSSPDNPDKAAERGLAVIKDLFPQWFRS
ncbi:hypothetical protein NKZ35_25380 [Sinorhizobium meliloti]|uniref:hypothetical protein n=1 Tax=Rhizobium meliloti TaxID=382 RepID=UPI003D66121B